jgi:hypothetical protein
LIIDQAHTFWDNSVIGAGSVVTKNVEADTVVAGNPTREIRTLYLPYKDVQRALSAGFVILNPRYRGGGDCENNIWNVFLLFCRRKKAQLFRVGLSCIWSLAMS